MLAPLHDLFVADPEEGIEHALALLPERFAEASCWWQATGSAGIKPGIRARLWFWLSKAISDGQAKAWLAEYPVDSSLFTPVALHYTAPPVLAPGTPDPMTRRCGVRHGLADAVAVPDMLPTVAKADAATPGLLTGAGLTATDSGRLAAAVYRSSVVQAIWAGERTFADRSTGHFALAAALGRAGCRDPDTIHRVLVAYDRRHGHDTTKIERTDYARRTIAAALARSGSSRP